MSNKDFSIIEDKSNDKIRKFIVKGRVTSENANILQHKIEWAFKLDHINILVNMGEVSFLSSGGIRVLLMFYKKAKELDGTFYVEEPSENVINVLGLTALDEMLMK